MSIEWTDEDSAAAVAEGWDVFHVDNAYHDIQRCDGADLFGDDTAAVAHVFYMASAGSELHRKAITYVLRPGNICPAPARRMSAP